MEVVTVVTGRIAKSKVKDFENAYSQVGRKGPFAEGFLWSRLLRGTNDPRVYRIETTWKSKKLLDKYRKSVTTPFAVLFFQKYGSSPMVEIQEVAGTTHTSKGR